jgi:hypothetical protein
MKTKKLILSLGFLLILAAKLFSQVTYDRITLRDRLVIKARSITQIITDLNTVDSLSDDKLPTSKAVADWVRLKIGASVDGSNGIIKVGNLFKLGGDLTQGTSIFAHRNFFQLDSVESLFVRSNGLQINSGAGYATIRGTNYFAGGDVAPFIEITSSSINLKPFESAFGTTGIFLDKNNNAQVNTDTIQTAFFKNNVALDSLLLPDQNGYWHMYHKNSLGISGGTTFTPTNGLRLNGGNLEINGRFNQHTFLSGRNLYGWQADSLQFFNFYTQGNQWQISANNIAGQAWLGGGGKEVHFYSWGSQIRSFRNYINLADDDSSVSILAAKRLLIGDSVTKPDVYFQSFRNTASLDSIVMINDKGKFIQVHKNSVGLGSETVLKNLNVNFKVHRVVSTDTIGTRGTEVRATSPLSLSFAQDDSTNIFNLSIADNSVGFNKIQSIATGKLLGRSSVGSGNIEPLTPDGTLAISGGNIGVVANTVNQKVELMKGGASVATRKTINFIDGTNTTINIADDVANDRLNVTVNSTASGGGSGVTTLAAIGSTPNANGGTITGTTLNMQPADHSFGGVVTTADQEFAGRKSLDFASINYAGGGSADDNIALYVKQNSFYSGIMVDQPSGSNDAYFSIKIPTKRYDFVTKLDGSFVISDNNAGNANRFQVETGGDARVYNKLSVGLGTSPTAFLHIAPSTTSFASLRFGSGVAPTAPNGGDAWYDGTNLLFRSTTSQTIATNTNTLTFTNKTWNGDIITSAFGGTGNGFTKFSGPASSEKTFTLPNASASILTDNTAVTIAQGGTGASTQSAALSNILGASLIGSANGGTGNGFAKLSGPTTSEKTFTLPDASANILTDNTAVTIAQGGTGATTQSAALSNILSTSVIGSVNGGTGNGFAKLSGPATSEKTFTLPNASANILTDNTAVTIAQGGTGATTQSAALSNILSTSVIGSVNGGTGNGFAKLSGPATSEKTFTLPNASANILTDNAAVTIAQGGTGATTQSAALSNILSTSVIGSVNGGTGNGFVKFSGPATSEKTFTLPNASATLLTDNAAVTIAQGGTGQTTANAALNALLPSQTSNAGKIIKTDGTNTAWAFPGSILQFSQTTNGSVANTVTETTLFGAGQGSLTANMSALPVGTVIIYKGYGKLTSKATSPGTVTVNFKAAGLTMSQAFTPTAGLGNAVLSYEFTITVLGNTGSPGTLNTNRMYKVCVDNATVMSGMLANQTSSSISTVTFDATATFSLADVANTITTYGNTVEIKRP